MTRTPARRCAICGVALPRGSRPDRLTCGPAHAKQLQRAKQRTAKRQQVARDRATADGPRGDVDHAPNSDVVELVRRDAEDTAREALKEEIRPVIREALDEDVMRAIRDMVGLAPAAVRALKDDLEGDDPLSRSRAAQLVVKYTLGNPNVTPAREDSKPGLTIINQMPDAPAPFIDSDALDELPEDTRRCDTCATPRPLSAFPGDGPRCEDCLAERKQEVLDSLRGSGAMGAPTTDGIAQAAPAVTTPPPPPPPRDAAAEFGGPPDPKRFSDG